MRGAKALRVTVGAQALIAPSLAFPKAAGEGSFIRLANCHRPLLDGGRIPPEDALDDSSSRTGSARNRYAAVLFRLSLPAWPLSG